VFVLVGTFVEEVFSPIPSFVVLVPAGAGVAAQGGGAWQLAILVLLSAIGRIAGAAILYKLADVFEDRLLMRGRKFFGLSHTEIEQFGQRLNRAGKRNWVLLFVMNALPIFPAAMLSLGCGFLKVNYRMFLACTFFGTMINALLYLLIGYGGLRTAETLRGLELATQIVVGVLTLALVVWVIRKRNERRRNRPRPDAGTVAK
jgi:membrane protein DedA with SNARE-associated domain